MRSDAVSIVAPLIGLCLNASFQICAFKSFLKSALLKSVVFGFFAGGCCLFLLGLVIADRAGVIVENMIVYILFSYCYFHFINLGETSRRIRILRELTESDHGLSWAQLLARYNAQEIMERRLRRLIKNGQVIVTNDQFHIGRPFVLWMAYALMFLKRVLLGKRGGLIEL